MGRGESRRRLRQEFRAVPIQRASEHFMGRHEMEEFDRRVRLAGRRTDRRLMAMAWWIISTGCDPKVVTKIGTDVPRHPRLRLLPQAWAWLDLWLAQRKRRGLDMVMDAPLFCTTSFDYPRTWPGPMSMAAFRHSMKNLGIRMGAGRVSLGSLRKLHPQFMDARLTRKEFEGR